MNASIKIKLAKNTNYMRISGIEPSSVIRNHTKIAKDCIVMPK